jgi:hypothetical protein
MRVISQHGNVDLPYEQIVVCHAMESVIALYNGEKYVLGKYSSKEKAYKAMEMLREAFFENKHEETYREGIYYYSPCFQFPQDDEIEA